jgi:UDP-N-acetylmuramoylalanine--D-glutamate ligase
MMSKFKNKKVAVLGIGVSGISAIKLLKRVGADVYAINQGDVEFWSSTNNLLEIIKFDHCISEDVIRKNYALIDFDFLILSPGIPRDHFIPSEILKSDKVVIGEIELAYQISKENNFLVPIIAVTGTNGKTTTTTFLGEILSNQKKATFVGGNIGLPFCEYVLDCFESIEYDYILLELSSFQLESIVEFRPNVAVILNIFQNHGERYASIEEYFLAKSHIADNMQANDILIYPSDFDLIDHWAQNIKIKKIQFNTSNVNFDFDTSSFSLPGLHNLINLKFVTIVSEILNIKNAAFLESVKKFKGVHFRVEKVPGSFPFIAYNDSKSTNWDATITAIKAMNNASNLAVIIGGKMRGFGDSILPYLDFFNSNVKILYLIGEAGAEIDKELKQTKANFQFEYCQNLEFVFQKLNVLKFNGTLLFSPSFPSFDQYRNYEERGEHFNDMLFNYHLISE